jgi:hypothetical protein
VRQNLKDTEYAYLNLQNRAHPEVTQQEIKIINTMQLIINHKTFQDMTRIEVRRDSAVGIETGYGLDDRGVGVRVPVGARIFISPCRPDRLWGPPNLLSSGYRWLFPRGQSGRGVELTTHLQLVPRSRKCGSIYALLHTPSWRSA